MIISYYFRKRPVVVEAVQFIGGTESGNGIVEWISENGHSAHYYQNDSPQNSTLEIYTLEGRMYAHVGDWIIKGVHGEFYPCKPDIFAKTHEKL